LLTFLFNIIIQKSSLTFKREGVVKMRGIEVKRNGWKEIFGLADDLKEWIQFLEKEARDDSQPIWGDLSTKDIVILTKKLLKRFVESLVTADGKIDETQKKAFQEIRIEVQALLDSFRKERRI